MREASVYAVNQGVQEVHLIGRQVFGLLDKQRLTGIEQAVYAILHVALRCLMLRFQPYQPSQLLHIRRIAVGHGAYLAGQFFRNIRLNKVVLNKVVKNMTLQRYWFMIIKARNILKALFVS